MSRNKIHKSKSDYTLSNLRSYIIEYFLHEDNIDDFHSFEEMFVFTRTFANGQILHVFQLYSKTKLLNALSELIDMGIIEVINLGKRQKKYRISRTYLKIQYGIDLDEEAADSGIDEGEAADSGIDDDDSVPPLLEGEDENFNRKLTPDELDELQEASSIPQEAFSIPINSNDKENDDDNLNRKLTSDEWDALHKVSSNSSNSNNMSNEEEKMNTKLSPQELDALQDASYYSNEKSNEDMFIDDYIQQEIDEMDQFQLENSVNVTNNGESEEEVKQRVSDSVRQLVDALLRTPGVNSLLIRQLLYYFETSDNHVLHERFVSVFDALQLRGFTTLREGYNVSRVHQILHQTYKTSLLEAGVHRNSSRYNYVELIYQRSQNTYMELVNSLPPDDPLIDLFVSGIKNPNEVEVDAIDLNDNYGSDSDFHFNDDDSVPPLLEALDVISPVKKIDEDEETYCDEKQEECDENNNSNGSIMKDDVSGNSDAYSCSDTYTGSHQSDRDFISVGHEDSVGFDLSVVSSRDVSEVTDNNPEDSSLITAEVGKRVKRKKTYENYEDDMSLFSRVSSHQRINTPEPDSSFNQSASEEDGGIETPNDDLQNDSGDLSDLTK